ncbi:TRAP transporter substrate-binding protein [Pseudoruegeria sp. SK021]|uniref:TRAP transporter substrate-binding protein n=1 Tax=Pseudoruegeria sp. SK021 TaxID=1933035 RepID=UPI00143DDDFC|nr:TRAP transporter substrate-binding protein [Pseudoruegeria sp. SK021]
MKFRHSAFAAALSVAVIPTLTLAETLKVSTFVPPNHAFNVMLAQWGEELSEQTDGELTLEIFPSGQLGPPPRQYDLVTSGAADISLILHAATPGRFPVTELVAMPFTTPSVGDDSAAMSQRLTEIAPEFLAAEHPDVKILWMAVTPALKLHLTDVDPSTLAAFKGLRIRYAGATWQQIIERLGASPAPVPPAETADAMSKGIVDGASFPFEAAQSFDLAPLLKYSLEPGIASASFAVVMSQAAFDKLPAEMQTLIDETTGPARAAAFGEMWDTGEAEARQYLIDGGVSVVSMSDAEMADMQAALEPIRTELIENVTEMGLPARAFLDAYEQ